MAFKEGWHVRLGGVPCACFKNLDFVARDIASVTEAVEAALDGVKWPESMDIAFAKWRDGPFEYKRSADADDDEGKEDYWTDVDCLYITPIEAKRDKETH